MRMKRHTKTKKRERESTKTLSKRSCTRVCVCWNDGKRVCARAHVRVDTLWQSWENYSIWSTYPTSEISVCWLSATRQRETYEKCAKSHVMNVLHVKWQKNFKANKKKRNVVYKNDRRFRLSIVCVVCGKNVGSIVVPLYACNNKNSNT